MDVFLRATASPPNAQAAIVNIDGAELALLRHALWVNAARCAPGRAPLPQRPEGVWLYTFLEPAYCEYRGRPEELNDSEMGKAVAQAVKNAGGDTKAAMAALAAILPRQAAA
jgi:hypothetical protein